VASLLQAHRRGKEAILRRIHGGPPPDQVSLTFIITPIMQPSVPNLITSGSTHSENKTTTPGTSSTLESPPQLVVVDTPASWSSTLPTKSTKKEEHLVTWSPVISGMFRCTRDLDSRNIAEFTLVNRPRNLFLWIS
jgi:hypothetical protein